MTPDYVTLASAVVAALGLVVTYHAYRGYRRHGSETVGLLAVGVACFTVVPFVATALLSPALAWSDGITLLVVVAAYNAGLLAILRSLGGD